MWLAQSVNKWLKSISSSGHGKCTFDKEKSSHIRNFSQSNRRESTSLTSSGSYSDSSTRTYIDFKPKNSEDNCETSNAERRALNTHTGHFTVIISKRFHFFVVLELQWSLSLICYIFNSLNTEFRSPKKNAFSFQHLLLGSVFRQYSKHGNGWKWNCQLLFVFFLQWKLLVMLRSVYKWSVFFILFFIIIF